MDFKSARLLSWQGDLPELGHYLQTRKGSTYLIIAVHPNKRINPKSLAKLDLLKLTTCDVTQLPEEAVIHSFQWTQRAS